MPPQGTVLKISKSPRMEMALASIQPPAEAQSNHKSLSSVFKFSLSSQGQ